jgi:uncharacterized damage-inducible protein DinB
MQPTNTLTTLFDHNLWANTKLLELCAELSEEQLDASIVGTFGSIRSTLAHIVSSERSYLYRINTGQPMRQIAGEPPSTLAEMLVAVRQSGQGLIEAAPKIQPTDAVKVDWKDQTIKVVPLAIYLTQTINHATEHRAQIMATLTQLGIEPPSLDSWSYLEALAAKELA